MSRAAILCASVSIPFVAGCPGPANCRPGDDAPTLEIGWGEEGFEPLDEEDPTMRVIHGDQDGYHVPIALEATGLYARNLLGSNMKGWIDGQLHAETTPWVMMRCNPHTRTLQSWNSLLIWDLEPPDLDGRLAHIEVTVEDIDGGTASAEADVRLLDPPVDTGP